MPILNLSPSAAKTGGDLTAVEDEEKKGGAPRAAKGFEFFSPEGVAGEM